MRFVVAFCFFSTLGLCTLQATETSSAAIQWQENLSTTSAQPANAPEDVSKQAKRPVLVYITVPNCSYCVKMKSDTFAHRNVIQQVRKKFTAVKVDGRKHAEVAKRLKVKLYPTTAIVHPSGAVVDVIAGYLGPQQFLKRLANAEQKLDYQSKLMATKSRSTSVK